MRSHPGRGCKVRYIPEEGTLAQHAGWKSNMSSDRQFWIMELTKMQCSVNLCEMGTDTTYSHSPPLREPHGTRSQVPLPAATNLCIKVLFLAFNKQFIFHLSSLCSITPADGLWKKWIVKSSFSFLNHIAIEYPISNTCQLKHLLVCRHFQGVLVVVVWSTPQFGWQNSQAR